MIDKLFRPQLSGQKGLLKLTLGLKGSYGRPRRTLTILSEALPCQKGEFGLSFQEFNRLKTPDLENQGRRQMQYVGSFVSSR